jgi:hypothetical protein
VNKPGSKCVTCGTTEGPFNADHITALAIEHLTTGTIDKKNMRSIKSTQSQCVNCSNNQGVQLKKSIREVNCALKQKQQQNGQ